MNGDAMLSTIARIFGAFICMFGVYLVAGALYLAAKAVFANPVQPDAIEATPKEESAGLLITWQPPTKYVDGTDLPPVDITGYDLYHTVNGGEVQYTAWIPQTGDVKKYSYQPADYGRYCFQLVTVTKSAGKSAKSQPPVCIDYVEKTEPEIPVTPDPETSPCEPNTVEVEQISWLFNEPKKRWVM